MTEEHRLISAESVTEGHPDKVCDQISDAILDDLLAQDSSSHVAVETSAATGVFLVFGEVTSEGYCDVQSKVRKNPAQTSATPPPKSALTPIPAAWSWPSPSRAPKSTKALPV